MNGLPGSTSRRVGDIVTPNRLPSRFGTWLSGLQDMRFGVSWSIALPRRTCRHGSVVLLSRPAQALTHFFRDDVEHDLSLLDGARLKEVQHLNLVCDCWFCHNFL